MGESRKRSCMKAYLAGLFDGEGMVGIYPKLQNNKYKSYFTLCQVTMTDVEAVMLLWLEYPGGSLFIKPPHTPERSPQLIYRFSGKVAREFLKDIKPYCFVKQEQVKVALAFEAFYARNYATRLTNPRYLTNCERYSKLISALKKPNINRVNSVNLYEMREYRAKREDVDRDSKIINDKFRELREGVETSVAASQSQ
jgi:hypothetical protein